MRRRGETGRERGGGRKEGREGRGREEEEVSTPVLPALQSIIVIVTNFHWFYL